MSWEADDTFDRDELEGEVDANPLGAVDCMHFFAEYILDLLADRARTETGHAGGYPWRSDLDGLLGGTFDSDRDAADAYDRLATLIESLIEAVS